MYISSVENSKKATRYELGVELDARLADLSAGYKGAPITGLIREAVENYITQCLDNEPKVKVRHDEARKKRLSEERGEIFEVINGDHES